MAMKIDPYLTEADTVVLQNLFKDVDKDARTGRSPNDIIPSPEAIDRIANDKTDHPPQDQAAIDRLKAFNDPGGPDFKPTVFVTWDDKDIPLFINQYLVQPYAKVAARIVRHPTDVVFLTHILLYLFVNLPSALWLFYRFSYLHGIAHAVFTFWCAGSFTLMLHNHIHNNGVLSRKW